MDHHPCMTLLGSTILNSEFKWTSLLPLPSLQPVWFLMVGGDRSFKLALTEKDEEFSDELREDCEVKGVW